MSTIPQESSFAYNSFIKNINLEIPGGYQYRHHSFGREDDEQKANEADNFLGRKGILKSFVDILNSESNRGAYLVTGFRGMGKTSFVNQALNKLDLAREEERKLIAQKRESQNDQTAYGSKKNVVPFWFIRLSLAQSELKDVDVLKHIVNKLLAELESTDEYVAARRFSTSNLFGWLWPLMTAVLLYFNFGLLEPGRDGQSTIIENMLGIVSFSALITLFFSKIGNWSYGKYVQNKPRGRRIIEVSIIIYILVTALYVVSAIWSPFIPFRQLSFLLLFIFSVTTILAISIQLITDQNQEMLKKGEVTTIKAIHEKLSLLYKRCNAQMTSEDQFRETFSSSVSTLFRKDVLVYPIANPREIESELIDIIGNLTTHRECIFVFDELDKVDPNFDQAVLNSSEHNADRRTHLNDLRERRHMITQILGSLKYFINEAEAKFIFIAGREMFEAALADISDRQSSISSIFHRVIYVDSFLKDKSSPETIASSIGILVEKQLANILLPRQPEDTRGNATLPYNDFFSNYYYYLTHAPSTEATVNGCILDEAQARKTIFVLQNFLGYLVYRSNGSPKKVVKLLEEYITLGPPIDRNGNINQERNIVFSKTKPTHQVTHYLRFSYLDQYKLGFTAYLFQPFLTMYSSFMKRYSDNTLVSTPYLIDNLIKFHPFAFSAQNLELIPEILSTNKSPISRPFLEELITFLGQNHIRRTESGLFEYKFYDRTHNEITFISKIFEDEAAAFNFTLDENYSVKAHLIHKIRQLRETHRPVTETDSTNENPPSAIIFLNRILGDVRFQDEEFEDAIVSYQDAIQLLNFNRLKYANYFITFVRLKLKLGLTYEKIKAYEFALGHYAGVIEEAGNSLFIEAEKHSTIYRELLALVMQAHSAILYIQEKLQEGITFQKTKEVVQDFEKLLLHCNPYYANRDILLATFYSNIGTAVYYKNMVLPQKINEERVKALRSQHQPGHEILDERALEKVRACFPASLHDFVDGSIQEIRSIYKMDNIHEDARLSFTTYIYYKKTLHGLLGCEALGLPSILSECTKLIHTNPGDHAYRSLQHKRRLTSIGHALAKLGDYLLPAVVDRISTNRVGTTEITKINVIEVLGCFYNLNLTEWLSNKNNVALEWTENQARHQLQSIYFHGGVEADLTGKVHPRLIVHMYYLACLFYLEAGETANGAFQLRKILFALRSLPLYAPKGHTVVNVLSCLETSLMKRILELSSWMSHSSDRPQLSKTKKYLNITTLRTPHSVSSALYGNLSNNPDTKETVLAYALLKTHHYQYELKAGSLMDNFAQKPEHKLLSPYSSIAHHIIRIMECELHTSMNFKLLKTYTESTFKPILHLAGLTSEDFSIQQGLNSWSEKYFYACNLYDIVKKEWVAEAESKKEPEEEQLRAILTKFDAAFGPSTTNLMQTWLKDYADLVINSIFNLCQIDRTVNTYGINYILSYSYMAQVQEHLGTWLKHLHFCRILERRYITTNSNEGSRIDELLNDLIGPQLTTSLDALTSYQVALQYYYQAIQLHKEGNSYRHQINNLIYLEDDYNDNLYHFGAAIERLRINSGKVRSRIDFLKKELTNANMYKYSTYIGDEKLTN